MKAIVTKYHGPTGARGARITATAEGGNRLSLPYPHEIGGIEERHRAAAVALCEKKGWGDADRLVRGFLPDGKSHVFVWPEDGPARAAPEMLAALKNAEQWLGKMVADGGHKATVAPGHCERTLEQVAAAIAKAEGRS